MEGNNGTGYFSYPHFLGLPFPFTVDSRPRLLKIVFAFICNQAAANFRARSLSIT
jgi:hypothetical protein